MAFRATEIEKADQLGERIVVAALACASGIMEKLNEYEVGFRDTEEAMQFLIEFIAYYMHIVDRSAFAVLGVERREVFADRVIVAIVKFILAELSKEVSADDFCNALRDTYNRRQMEYSRYKSLVPLNDDSPKETLYWEYSKILLGFMNEQSPPIMLLLLHLIHDFTVRFLTKAPTLEDVLQS